MNRHLLLLIWHTQFLKQPQWARGPEGITSIQHEAASPSLFGLLWLFLVLHLSDNSDLPGTAQYYPLSPLSIDCVPWNETSQLGQSEVRMRLVRGNWAALWHRNEHLRVRGCSYRRRSRIPQCEKCACPHRHAHVWPFFRCFYHCDMPVSACLNYNLAPLRVFWPPARRSTYLPTFLASHSQCLKV